MADLVLTRDIGYEEQSEKGVAYIRQLLSLGLSNFEDFIIRAEELNRTCAKMYGENAIPIEIYEILGTSIKPKISEIRSILRNA